MRALITNMVSYRNSITDTSMEENKIAEYEKSYSDILDKAQKEYKEKPPGKYYRDGYNLYKRMQEYKDEHLLFLHDFRVPSTNNEAERHLRNYKRKQKQAISFRSFDSVDYLCQCMTLLESLRKKDINVFNHLSVIFN